MALSTGIVYEYVHPFFAIVRRIAVLTGRAPEIHAWTGPDQFIRRSALDAIGGIHPDIPYRAREDHQRMYELARYAKSINANMLSAASDPSLFDPVYHSGRRRGKLQDVMRALIRGRHKPPTTRDCYGYPVHPQDRLKA